jgi:hypothetical protein
MIVYWYGGNGQLYPPSVVDHDPVTGAPDSGGYIRYEIPDTVTLTAAQCLGSENVLEVLLRAGQAKRV